MTAPALGRPVGGALPHKPEPPADGRWARLPLEGGVAPTETGTPGRAWCGRCAAAAASLGPRGRGPARAAPLRDPPGAGPAPLRFDGDAGSGAAGGPCEGPARRWRAVARLLLAAHRASAARPNM